MIHFNLTEKVSFTLATKKYIFLALRVLDLGKDLQTGRYNFLNTHRYTDPVLEFFLLTVQYGIEGNPIFYCLKSIRR